MSSDSKYLDKFATASGYSKEQVASYLRSADKALEVLAATIKKQLRKDVTTEEDYQVANWPVLQAHRNGYNQAIRDVLKLLPTMETTDE